MTKVSIRDTVETIMGPSKSLTLSSFAFALGLVVLGPARGSLAESSPLGAVTFLDGVCEQIGEEPCGDSPEVLESKAESEHGSCVSGALGTQKEDEGYLLILVRCTCSSGRLWASGAMALEPIPYSKDRLDEISIAELANCHPSVQFGPSDIELIEAEQRKIRMAACSVQSAIPGQEEQESQCNFQNSKDVVQYRCSTPKGAGSSGSFEVQGWLSRPELYARCVDMATSLLPKPPQPEGGGIEDILDQLGCDVSTTSAPQGWGLAGLSLLGLASLRRRRR